MAIQYGHGQIVTLGLALNLDAADKNSYPGSGTAWNDTSGYGRNITLANGPTFNSANGGNLVFDGTNDYGNNTSTNITSIQYCTINMWIKDSVSTIAHRGPFWISDSSSRMLFLDIRSDYSHFQISTETKANNRRASSNQTQLVNGNWHNVVITRNDSTLGGYIDNTSISLTQEDGYGGWGIGTNDFSVGSFMDNGNIYSYWAGTIGSISIYNRVLSPSEILQNYTVQRKRFGI
jgi:hypothetical protein